MGMGEYIQEYIIERESKWAASTLKSESARLRAVKESLDGNPLTLCGVTRRLSRYSKVTTWTRVIDYVDWLIEQGKISGPNPYRRYRRDNNKEFKNAYKREHPKISYKEALLRVSSIKDERIREAATVILKTGLRAHELSTFENGSVVGKGGKRRDVYYRGKVPQVSYIRLYRQLKAVGLKPHDLRKLFASRLVEKGANEFQLTELMGWSSINTALSYVRSDPNKLESLVKEVIDE